MCLGALVEEEHNQPGRKHTELGCPRHPSLLGAKLTIERGLRTHVSRKPVEVCHQSRTTDAQTDQKQLGKLVAVYVP